MDTALFSPSSLFQEGSSDNDDDDKVARQGEDPDVQQLAFVERRHTFPGGMELTIREFSFHQLNANLLWPGTFAFSEWLFQNKSLLQGRRILELGSGTGALAIFMRRSFGVDITTSDFDDKEVEENIAYNCRANELTVLPHIRHTWGETFPFFKPDWDLIIASDILLYVKQYPNLIKTLRFLLNLYEPKKAQSATVGSSGITSAIPSNGKEMQLSQPIFVMSWRRRIGKDDESLFFTGCEEAGLTAEHVGARVYFIKPRRETSEYEVKM